MSFLLRARAALLAELWAPERRDATRLVLLAGAIGFLVGAWANRDWSVAAEPGQILAGLVHYETVTPFYLYQMKLWTILHQLSAVLFMIGLSEPAVCVVLSGLPVAVAYAALALVSFALCRSLGISLVVPLIVHASQAMGSLEAGSTYPIWFVAIHTYGILGLAYVLFVIALFAVEHRLLGAFLLGLGPCIHPSLGVWLILVSGLAIASDLGYWRPHARRGLWAFGAGALVCAISFVLYLAARPALPDVEPELMRRFVEAFAQKWDMHRQPVPGNSPILASNLWAAGLSLFCLLFLRRELPAGAGFLFRALIAAAAVGAAGVILSWQPLSSLPLPLLIAMPTRLLNLNVLASVSVLVGLLGAYRRWSAARLILAGLLLAIVAGPASPIWGQLGITDMTPYVIDPSRAMTVATLAALAIALVETELGGKVRLARAAGGLRRVLAQGSAGALLLAQIVGGVFFALATIDTAKTRAGALDDWRDDPLFKAVHEQQGLLATAGNHLIIQLRTRRPILLDAGSLDGVAYTLEASKMVTEILLRVYGLDLFNPPPFEPTGEVPIEVMRPIWENRSTADWQAIGREYGVTGVLAYPAWRLSLPEVARNNQREMVLYRIP
jgi:hypothetical protein